MSETLTFDNPWVFVAFAVFIPVILGGFLSSRRKRIRKSLPENLRFQLLLSQIFFTIFIICFIITLAGPHWGIGQGLSNTYYRAVDAVIALDVSRSMEIRDRQEGNGDELADVSRLERGLSIAREAVASVPGMRLGVAISRNRGIVTVPLTWDSDAALTFLDAAGSSLTGRGTNLESLLDAASGAFQPSSPSTKVILLVSDGEAHSGSLKAALGRCKRDGIAVSTIAVGSDGGGTLDDGQITSFRDPRAMQMAAGQTGGIYIDGNREDASKILAGYLFSLAPGKETRGNKPEYKSRWFIFIMSAIIAYGASKLCLMKLGRK